MQTYIFINSETGVKEQVQREKWRWVALYTDGRKLEQFDSNGQFHQFKEIDQARLAAFQLVSDSHPPVTLLFRQGMKLIHFYRTTVLDSLEPTEQTYKWFVMGYELAGKKQLYVILHTDELVITDDMERIKIT